MLNNELDSYTVTAGMDIICNKCYYDVGWENLRMPYANYTEPRELPIKTYKDAK